MLIVRESHGVVVWLLILWIFWGNKYCHFYLPQSVTEWNSWHVFHLGSFKWTFWNWKIWLEFVHHIISSQWVHEPWFNEQIQDEHGDWIMSLNLRTLYWCQVIVPMFNSSTLFLLIKQYTTWTQYTLHIYLVQHFLSAQYLSFPSLIIFPSFCLSPTIHGRLYLDGKSYSPTQ